MRLLPIGLALVLACGGGESGGGVDVAVTDLSNEEQVDLCVRFLEHVCAPPIDANLEGFCSNACIHTACGPAVEMGHVDVECTIGIDQTPITEQDVEDCGNAGNLNVCGQGGGCMFDALEAVCPGA